MSEEEGPPRSVAASEILYELGELRQALARMEALLRQIAISLGVRT